jgi:hypothetical protein
VISESALVDIKLNRSWNRCFGTRWAGGLGPHMSVLGSIPGSAASKAAHRLGLGNRMANLFTYVSHLTGISLRFPKQFAWGVYCVLSRCHNSGHSFANYNCAGKLYRPTRMKRQVKRNRFIEIRMGMRSNSSWGLGAHLMP